MDLCRRGSLTQGHKINVLKGCEMQEMQAEKHEKGEQPFHEFCAMSVGQKLRLITAMLDGGAEARMKCLTPEFAFRKMSHELALCPVSRRIAARAASHLFDHVSKAARIREQMEAVAAIAVLQMFSMEQREEMLKKLP